MTKTVAMFPGQGSQQVGMGFALAHASVAAREVWEAADSVLGFSLSNLCWHGPQEPLVLTENAQPAILTTSIAAWTAWQQRAQNNSLQPHIVCGHSLGEWSACVAAGVLSLADALRLVRLRGQAMQKAVTPGLGAMCALLGGNIEGASALCNRVSLQTKAPMASGNSQKTNTTPVVCAPANINGGGQIVLSGHTVAIERAMDLAKEFGFRRAIRLAVSAPFHCDLMTSAKQAMAKALPSIEFADAKIPVVSNVTGRCHTDAKKIKNNLLDQITSSVRWDLCMETCVESDVTTWIEFGHGRVLQGLVKKSKHPGTLRGISTIEDMEI